MREKNALRTPGQLEANTALGAVSISDRASSLLFSFAQGTLTVLYLAHLDAPLRLNQLSPSPPLGVPNMK
jgi:hypothetical protein